MTESKRAVTELQECIHICKRPQVTRVKPHIHKCIELVYICDGTGCLSIKDKSMQVFKGDLLFYNIGELHCLNSDDKINAVEVQIHPQIFDESLIHSQNAVDILTLAWFNDFNEIIAELKPKVTFKGKQRLEVEDIIQQMLKEYTEKETGYLGILFGYLNVLLGKLFRQIFHETKMDIRQEMPRIAEEVLNYIEKNYYKKLSLEELAGKSFYSPAYFSSVFKECYGISPMQYLNKKRLEKALELLTDINSSVEQVMHAVGFTDRKHFYTIFKESTGVTPGEFRKIKTERITT
ncbi:helix-turn-helix domain-containing protein [Desulfitobacterium sp. AusDCA]|uniref:AraC family transcriptional regulator n=1 Tax=Desulfitobacterium sp. AusDCA TaxID=3240383 RepID=UPI003DA7267B